MKRTALSTLLLLGLTYNGQAQSLGGLDTLKFYNATNGQTVALDNYTRSKLVVIVFTSNYCPYSRKYEDRINQIHTNYKDKGVQLILVNPNSGSEDSREEMKKKVTEQRYDVPYLSDKKQVLTNLLGASRTPEAYLLKPSGKILQVLYHGAIDDNPQAPDHVESAYLRSAIDAALQSRLPASAHEKVIGCIIKKS